MNNYKNILITLLMVLMGFPAFSQAGSVQVKGKVLDPYTNAPIEGAIVSATGLSLSATTDVNGEFVLDMPSSKGILNAWAPGFYTAEVPIMGRSYMEVILISSDKLDYSDEAQVPFEGTVNSRSLISSSSYLDKKNININKTAVEQLLLSIPGLQVIDKSGMPGEGSYFSIRGVNTFNAKSNPLIILDGMPILYDMNESPVINGYSKSPLNSISPKDIRNVTVLKGADAAVYGSMASNGVVMIETDKATDLDTQVEFIGQYGINMNQVTMPLLNTHQYKNYVNSVALTNYTLSSDITGRFPFLQADPDYYYKFLYNNDTDWQDLIYRPGFVTDNVLKIKGGDAIAKYDVSAGYMGNAGQVENTKFDKYHIRYNSDVNLTRQLSISTTLSTNYMISDLMETGMSVETNPLLAAYRKSPLLSPYKKDADNNVRPVLEQIGDYFTAEYGVKPAVGFNPAGEGSVNNMVSNPLAIVQDIQAVAKVYDIAANMGAKFTFNDKFAVSGIAGLYYNLNRESIFIPGNSEGAKTIVPLDGIANNTSRVGVGETFNLYFALNGTYKQIFNEVHSVSASAGVQLTMNNTEYDAGSGRNSTTDFYRSLDNTASSGRRFFGYNEEWNWMNFNVRGQYVYNNLVGVGAVLAADRSSATGADAQLFGFYPAANVALYLKNTPFLNDVNFVNKLTVRGDYTVTANSQFATSLSKYNYIGNRYREVTGIVRAGIPNTKLTPEITSTLSAGVDVSLFNYRVNLTAEFYKAKSKDLVMQRQISSAFGFNYQWDNIGEVENKGIELGAQFAILHKRDLKWNVGFTFNQNKNKILSLGGKQNIVTEMEDGSALISQVGQSMYSFYGYQTNGIYSTTELANKDGYTNVNGSSFQGGDVRFIDQNNDKIVNRNDRVIIGDATPDFFGNITTSFEYKAFKLSAIFGYSYGNKAYNATRRLLESSSDYANQYASVASRWVMEGQNASMPRAVFGDPQENNRFSDRFIEDASYIKLKELMISYKFPVMNGITVYAAAENLFTITNYLGLDPEFSYSYSAELQGFDYAKIALARSIKFGVKLQF